MKPSVIVIGGGVIGLSLAWELSGRGCEVTIVEKGELGHGTTWTAAGILPPATLHHSTDPIDQLRGLAHTLYPTWSERLVAETSVDIGLRRCGGWYLADTPGERAMMLGMTSYWDEMSIECESVSPDQLAKREPALAAWVSRQIASGRTDSAAWWVPDEFQIRPPRLIQALAKACDQAGVRLLHDHSVIDLRSGADQAVVKLDDGTSLVADQVAVCSGAWTGLVAEALQLEKAIIPIRGQILLLKTPEPLLRGIVNMGNRYLIARDDGHTLVGSCEEEAGFNTATDEGMLQTLHEFACDLIPEIRQAKRVSAWSGLRPMTFDGFPMIGRVPGQERIFVAAGHYRSGIHLAPATAVTMSDLMMGIDPAVDLKAFRVGKQQTHTR